MGRIITLPVHGMEVTLTGDGSGSVVSDLLQDPRYGSDPEWRAGVNAIENLVLAHALAGINVGSPIYVKGVELVVQALEG